ncbi:intestinal colonization autotransporter adhesin MisL [Kosakonia sp. BK9b]|uniref:autotransporter outer membrane beta-barrel domain-containing protein n=1 Tax=Kosakonia sp. TaxID=1916651 RepID=UPI0028A1357C|nr:autotransporter outer membrane beta-barrel domain-containing protein [Kosakonia sp.]
MTSSLKHSQLAMAISAILASTLFSANAAIIDFDNLPASGLVTDLPAEIQALIPSTASANYTKNTSDPNYVYQWNAGSIPVFGNGITLNGPGAEAFEHSVTVIQNSTTGSPGVIFGDDLTIYTQSKVAANNGKDVDGIRTHGTNNPNNPVFVITGDRTKIYVNGESGDGINAGYSSFSQGFLGSANIYVGNDAYIETTGSTGRGVTAYAIMDASAAKNNIILGDRAHIVTRGNYAEGIRTNQSGSYVRLGQDAVIETFGKSAYGAYAGSSSKIELGKNADITTSQDGASGVYSASSSIVSLAEGASITTSGAGAFGVYSTNAIVNLGNNASIAVNNASGTASSGLHALSKGKINLAGGAAITMAGDNASKNYAMSTVSGGVIDASAGGKFIIDGDLSSSGDNSAISLNMKDSSQWEGASYITGAGTTSVTMSDAVWNMTDSSTLTSLTLNSGAVVNVLHDNDGLWKTLTVNGDYTGNGGTLTFNTVLADDTSETDKMIVKGNTAGNTFVAINNIGGTGAQTVEGIEIIEVEGNSDGTFEKAGRIVAGGYDYNVVKKESNWYLTSEVEPEPTEPEGPERPVGPVDPLKPQPGGKHQYRPEFGSYLANNYAANTLFLTRLHDRLGETQYTDIFTGEAKTTSLWLRNVGGHNRFKDGSGQLKTSGNRYVMQVGGDLAQWSTDGLDRWHIGAMAGYANSQSRTKSNLTGYHSRSHINGYSVGLYGTWYANEADKTGTYVDSWALYNWFNNSVMGQEQATEKYKSNGITASVEAGYSFKVGENEQHSFWVQPKAQLVWMGVKAGEHREQNGTRVKDQSSGNVMTRLGVKAYLSDRDPIDAGKARQFQPFVEANWIHNTRSTQVKMDDVSNHMSGTSNIAELKMGVESRITPRLTMWGNVAQQVGSKGYSDTQGMLGVKYNF